MGVGIGFAVGLLVGVGIWFPWKHYLNKAVAKKRESTKLLVELARTEQEAMNDQIRAQNPQFRWEQPMYIQGTMTNQPVPGYQVGPGGVYQSGTSQAASGTSSGPSVSPTSILSLEWNKSDKT